MLIARRYWSDKSQSDKSQSKYYHDKILAVRACAFGGSRLLPRSPGKGLRQHALWDIGRGSNETHAHDTGRGKSDSRGDENVRHVRPLLAYNVGLSQITLRLLIAWRNLRLQAARLGKQLLAEAPRNQQCQLLMSIRALARSQLLPTKLPSRIPQTSSDRARWARGWVDRRGAISQVK